MIRADALMDWLDTEINRGDVVAWLRTQMVPGVDPDVRLLQLCQRLLPPRMWEPRWRGREFSTQQIAATAQSAIAGVEESIEWLQSLRDGRCFSFYAGLSTELRKIGETFLAAIEQYQAAWQMIIANGAPEAARPGERLAMAEAIHLAFSPAASAAQREIAAELFRPELILLRQSWFLTFGSDASQVSVLQLRVLQYLDAVSLLTASNEGILDAQGGIDPRRLRQGSQILMSHRALMRHLVARPGAGIVELVEGGVYSSVLPRSLAEHVRNWVRRGPSRIRLQLARQFRRLVEIAGRRVPALSRLMRSDEPHQTNVRVRLVRLTANNRLITPSVLDDEYYLALVSWGMGEAEEGLRLTLSLDQPGLFWTSPKLRLRNLPGSGQMLLVLTGDTRITTYRTSFGVFRRAVSNPIAIYFAPFPRITRDETRMLSVMGEVMVPTRDLLPAKGEILAVRSGIVEVKGKIMSPAGSIIKNSHWR